MSPGESPFESIKLINLTKVNSYLATDKTGEACFVRDALEPTCCISFYGIPYFFCTLFSVQLNVKYGGKMRRINHVPSYLSKIDFVNAIKDKDPPLYGNLLAGVFLFCVINTSFI